MSLKLGKMRLLSSEERSTETRE